MGDPWLPWNRPRRVLQPMPPGMSCKPWYKDRLPSKCLAKHKQEQLKFPTSLDGRRWVFVKEGLDDFRRGCPPCEGLITRSLGEGYLPTISHELPHDYFRKSRRKPEDANLYTKLSLNQQKRRAFMKEVEESLKKHPLTFWPLENDVPEDILSKVLEVLDPDKTMQDKWDCLCKTDNKVIEPSAPPIEELPKQEEDYIPPRFPGEHRYNMFHGQGVLQRKKPRKSATEKSLYYRYVPKGVYDFINWTESFGDLDIDAHFMMKQFEIGYKCKPSHRDSSIKKISLLPSELRYCSKLSKVKQIRFSIQESNFERKLRKPHDPYKSTKDTIRYGAWYLKPKIWRKLVNNEPLIDPKELLELEGRKSGKPDIIEDLYGTIAFKDFILSKGYNMPGILERLFMRKGWAYDTVNTPIPRVLKAYELIMQKMDEYFDDEND